MKVNPHKSVFVHGVRGSKGAKWMQPYVRQHHGRKLLDAGTASVPLEVPMGVRIPYLGVVASYGPFEDLSLSHRIQIASASRQRLTKVLQSGRYLTLTKRLELYRVCVRTSLLYGIPAVGITSKGLHRISTFELKHVRAIAKSPVHITR